MAIYAQVGNHAVLVNNEIYHKIQNASFLEKMKYISGSYTAERRETLLRSIEQCKHQLPKDLTEVRDRIKSVSLAYKEITDTELSVHHIVNTSNFFLRAVYKIASAIQSHFNPIQPLTIAKLNESISNDICQVPSHGILMGATVIGDKTYKIHAMPQLRSMEKEGDSTTKIDEVMFGENIFSILDEANKPLSRFIITHRYQAEDGSLTYSEKFKNDGETYERFLQLSTPKSDPTYAIGQIWTQIALEIFNRDADTRLEVRTGNFVPSVLIDAGFDSTGNAEAMKQIKEKLAKEISKQPAIEPETRMFSSSPNKYISDFNLQMFKHARPSSPASKSLFYVKPEVNTEVDVTVTGVWKTYLDSQKDLPTWETIMTHRPILSGNGPVLPDSWEF